MSSDLRVLIVDDNPDVRRMIRDLLEDLASEIEECADGDEVVGTYAAFRPHWVLMDVRMPRLDGIAATAALRAAHPEARVIMVSDHEQADMRNAARHAGAEGYVAKRDLLELPRLLAETQSRQ